MLGRRLEGSVATVKAPQVTKKKEKIKTKINDVQINETAINTH